jgi:hypothetical protein
MTIDIKKENGCEGCNHKTCECSCHISIGNRNKEERTGFQKFLGHMSNIFWFLFFMALIFAHNEYLIIALFFLAFCFDEFD